MIKIKYKPNYSNIISDLNPKVKEELSQVLSYDKHNRYYGTSTICLLTNKLQRFPSGLLYLIQAFFDKKGIEYEVEGLDLSKPDIKNIREVNKYLSPFNKELRNYQVKSLVSAAKNGRGIIQLATGLGKSLTLVALYKLYNMKTIILVDGKDGLNQIIEELEVFDDTYLVLEGKKSIKDFVSNGWEDYNLIIGITPSIYRNLGLVKRTINEANLLIVDECHRIPRTFYKAYMALECPYRFGLTATPRGRSDSADLKIRGVFGRIIYKKDLASGIDDGYLAKTKAYFIRAINDVSGDDYNYLRQHGIVLNEERNNAIKKLCQHHSDKIIYIIVSIINHGHLLKELLEEVDIHADFLHGETPKDLISETIKLYRSKESGVLIMSPIGYDRINIPNIDVVIDAGGGGGVSTIPIEQKLGRGVRKGNTGEVVIYNFYDSQESSVLRKHSTNRRKYYKQCGIESKIVDIETIVGNK